MLIVLPAWGCATAGEPPYRIEVEVVEVTVQEGSLQADVTQPGVMRAGERASHEVRLTNTGDSAIQLGDPRFNLRDDTLFLGHRDSSWVRGSDGDLVSGGNPILREVTVEPGETEVFEVHVLPGADDIVLQPGDYEVTQDLPGGTVTLSYVVEPAT